MLKGVYDLVGYVQAVVVQVVCHWDHACRGEAVSEASRAHLAVEVQEQALVDQFLREYVWVFL